MMKNFVFAGGLVTILAIAAASYIHKVADNLQEHSSPVEYKVVSNGEIHELDSSVGSVLAEIHNMVMASDFDLLLGSDSPAKCEKPVYAAEGPTGGRTLLRQGFCQIDNGNLRVSVASGGTAVNVRIGDEYVVVLRKYLNHPGGQVVWEYKGEWSGVVEQKVIEIRDRLRVSGAITVEEEESREKEAEIRKEQAIQNAIREALMEPSLLPE